MKTEEKVKVRLGWTGWLQYVTGPSCEGCKAAIWAYKMRAK